MQSKGVIWDFLRQIIGGVIVVAIIIVIFASLSSVFVESMIDSKNIKTFDKFSIIASHAADTGNYILPYLGLTADNGHTVYAIAAVVDTSGNDDVYNFLVTNSKVSSKTKVEKCSQSVLGQKHVNDFCYCLFKIYAKPGETRPNSYYMNGFGYDTDFIYVDPNKYNSEKEAMQSWSKEFKKLLDDGHIEKVRIVTCKSMSEMGLVEDGQSGNLIYLKDKNDNLFVYWQARVSHKIGNWAEDVCEGKSKVFDSIRMERPFDQSSSKFENYLNIISIPEMEGKNLKDVSSLTGECKK